MRDKNENKKSKLVFDAKLTRKLLKMNGEIKYCQFCGKSVDEGCSCHRNIVVDVKPYRNSEGQMEADRTVFVFSNNDAFKADYDQLMDELKAKKEAEEPEQIEIEFDVEVEVDVD